MNRRSLRIRLYRHRRLLASVAVGLAVWSALQVLRPAEPSTIAVAVARNDLPSGHVLAAADVAVTRMPMDSLPLAARIRASELVGRALVGPVLGGEPITATRVLGPSLLRGVGAGRVAISVRVRDAGTVGLLRSGDVVDVLAATKGGALEDTPTGAVSLARHARVLVVPTQPEGGLLSGGADRRYDGTLVVLAVSEADALRIAENPDNAVSLVLIR